MVNKFEIRETKGRGRGLFALCDIPAGTLLERSPCVRIPENEYKFISQTILEHYVFTLRGGGGDVLLALGMGSMFNHDKNPNVDYRIIPEKNIIEFYAIRKIPEHVADTNNGEFIKKGTELVIYYGSRPEWDIYTDDEEDSEWSD
eukprot:g3673.t1